MSVDGGDPSAMRDLHPLSEPRDRPNRGDRLTAGRVNASSTGRHARAGPQDPNALTQGCDLTSSCRVSARCLRGGGRLAASLAPQHRSHARPPGQRARRHRRTEDKDYSRRVHLSGPDETAASRQPGQRRHASEQPQPAKRPVRRTPETAQAPWGPQHPSACASSPTSSRPCPQRRPVRVARTGAQTRGSTRRATADAFASTVAIGSYAS